MNSGSNEEFKIPGYKITEKLYESRSTVVYRGILLTNKNMVVLKIQKPQAAAEKDEVTRFRHEFEIISKLNLPGVVKPIALEEYNGGLLMVMADIGGKSLDHFPLPLPLVQLLEISIVIADALGSIHKRQIIHKNINPSNMIWNSETKQLNLIDFGIADEIPEQTVSLQAPSAIEGTLEYISPEQTGRMNRVVDYRTDLYSLGATFYHLLTGQLPFAASDALGIVHLHIAGTAQSPHKINPDIPEMVSCIVLKLMAKMADDRYQSAWALKADLERCFQECFASGTIKYFELGKEDYIDRLRVPQKLYGREKETEQLLNAFERVRAGGRELFLVAGYAGIGKTALVHEVHRYIAEKQGYFIEGKFNQLRSNEPYFAWIQALEGFVNYLLMESEEQLDYWRRIILSGVGGSGRVLTAVIPNLELIIGAQSDVPTLGATESQNRFNYVFLEFIKAIGTSEHPLVVFFDDLQWIDAASLNLLKNLISNDGVSNILVIGVYRDNEVDVLHPLMAAIEALRKEKARIDQLTIGNLSEEIVNELISGTLHRKYSEALPLTHLIYSKTGGNPFFLLQTLRTLADRQVISFDIAKRCWNWDICAIKAMKITDNVVDLMLGKIQQLAPETQDILTLAACMGFRFNLSNLGTIAELSENATLEIIMPALREGFIASLDGGYQFVHDRVQQAAYSLIPEDDKKAVHLQIGRLLLEHMPDNNHEEQLFTVVDHLNIGAVLLNSLNKKLELADLNLRAGFKARMSSAFLAAANYFEAGLVLLDADSWITHYDLTLELHTKAGEAASLIGAFDRTDQMFNIVVRNAKTPVDMVGAYESQMHSYISQGKLKEAIDISLECCEKLGLRLPSYPTNEDIAHGIEETKSLYAGISIEDLVDLPKMTDPDKLAILRIYHKTGPVAYISRPPLVLLMIFSGVNLSIKYGNAAEPFHYAAYGFVLCGLLREYDEGYRFAKLALSILSRMEAGDRLKFTAKTLDLIGGHTWHFRHHLNDTLAYLEKGYQDGLKAGDLENAGYCAFFFCCNSYFAGVELQQLEQVMGHYGEALKRIRAETVSSLLAPYQQAVENLLRPAIDSCFLRGRYFNQEEMLLLYEQKKNSVGIATFYVNRLMLCYLFEQYEQALECAELVKKNKDGLLAMFAHSASIFYDSLTRLRVYPDRSSPERALILEKVSENQLIMKGLADSAPMNFLHKWHLAEAEKMRVLDNVAEAIEHYNCAILLARENGFIQEEALANELAGRFWLEKEKDIYAHIHIDRACRGYAQWQAWAKVKALEAKYPQWLKQKDGEDQFLKMRSLDKDTKILDLDTVTKATRAISSEIEVDRLLGEVLHSVIENAGAQKGSLLMERDDKWAVVAQAEIGRTEVEISSPISIEEGDIVSLGVIRFVARTQERVLLDNAVSQGEFVSDTYIAKNGTKSLLCAPLLSRGRLIGILYLENNLTAFAFTDERVQFLEMLLSQAAISLENSIIYEALKKNRDHLDELVKERTSQLEVAKEQAEVAKEQAESANSAKSIFLANMSHELRTPLNAILGFSRLMKEGADVTEEQKKNLDIINVSGGHLLNLINNVLDISKIESGRITLDKAPLNLHQLIQEMRSLLYVSAEERGLNFFVEQSPDLPRQIEIDRGKLRQVLINLIGNAIKYTKNGGVILRAMVVKRDTTEQVYLRFEVEDTGPGISDEDKKRIFQPFIQLREVGSIETGTGLGLAICRQYVDIMGGSIEVVSKKSKGSIFYFEVPAKELQLEEIPDVQERGRVIGIEDGQPRYRLLIAEDQLENRILLHKMLEPPGFDIREAVNGKEALEIFEQWHPDLIWMDIRMPIMDGLEATHQIKSTSAGLHTKVIAITAQTMEEDIMKIMQAGCDDFIRKPFRNAEIFDVLTRHLGLRFVYEEKAVTPSIEPELALQPEQLSVLPPDLILQLNQAVMESNPEDINLLINKIFALDPDIGRALWEIADKFDYYRILKLLNDFKKSREL